MTDQAQVTARPELAVPFVMAHAEDPQAVEIGRSARAAAAKLDEKRARFYADLVYAYSRKDLRRRVAGHRHDHGTTYGRYSFMHTTERTEARLLDANNILVAPSTLGDQGLIRDFCGSVINLDDLSSALPSLAQKTVYLCGDVSRVNGHHLHAAERVFVIRELSQGYHESEGKAWTLVDLGQVPILVHGVGVYYRAFSTWASITSTESARSTRSSPSRSPPNPGRPIAPDSI